MNIRHVMRVFHGSVGWAWAFVTVPVLRSLPAVVAENTNSTVSDVGTFSPVALAV
jgi:hypothetical protein